MRRDDAVMCSYKVSYVSPPEVAFVGVRTSPYCTLRGRWQVGDSKSNRTLRRRVVRLVWLNSRHAELILNLATHPPVLRLAREMRVVRGA